MRFSTFLALLLNLWPTPGPGHAPFGGGGTSTIDPHFTARKIQGETCLAPCAVHFDAIGKGSLSAAPYATEETTDSAFTRPFHSLLFEWDFGDPNSGTWSTGAAAMTSTPQSKNYDIGGIAGHLYENPGTYTVTLTVTNPAGESAQTTRQVVVGDRTTYFSAADTFCFANDDSNWAGCPLNCATDDNCTVTADLDLLLNAGDNCSGTDDCANADNTDGGQRRILLRRGDTFTASTWVRLHQNTASPGFIEAFGSGARPIMNYGGNMFEDGDSWTHYALQLTNCNTACIFPNVNSDNDSWIDIRVYARGGASCIDETVAWPVETFDGYGKLRAYFGLACDGDDASVTAHAVGYWPGSDYSLLMGGYVSQDPNQLGSGNDRFTMRSHHMQHFLIAHFDHRDTGPALGVFQLRSDDSYCYDGGCELPQSDNAYVLIEDNYVENHASEVNYLAQTCPDSGCNCFGNPCSGSGQGTVVPVHDFIFERNFHAVPDGTPTTRNYFYRLFGRDITIRNDVYDLTGSSPSNTDGFASIQGDPLNAAGDAGSGNVQIYNNTLYFSDTKSANYIVAEVNTSMGNGCPSGCYARNNLIVAPNHSGSLTYSGSITQSNNLEIKTPNPFVAAVPARGMTSTDDFALAAASAPIDAGYDFSPGTDTDRWVYDDAMMLCRSDGQWDVGAHEYGASACY